MSIITSTCAKDHKYTRKCYDKAAVVCQKCDAARRAEEKRRQRDHELDQERQTKQRAYLAKLIEIEDEMEHQKRRLRHRDEEADREAALAQKKIDLENLKNRVSIPARPAKPSPDTSVSSKSAVAVPPPGVHSAITQQQGPGQASARNTGTQANAANNQSSAPTWDQSDAKDDWEQQKNLDGAVNEALDSLMPMIGEDAKIQERASTNRAHRLGIGEGKVSCNQE